MREAAHHAWPLRVVQRVLQLPPELALVVQAGAACSVPKLGAGRRASIVGCLPPKARAARAAARAAGV